jgi:hypothetical protein
MSPRSQDGLPEVLIPDPAHPPRIVAFAGYLGESHNQGSVRLYLDEELREWFDVEEANILHSEQYGEGTSSRTVIWVDQRTTLRRRLPQDEALEDGYLSGDLAAETVPQSAMSVAMDASVARRTPMKSPYCAAAV